MGQTGTQVLVEDSIDTTLIRPHGCFLNNLRKARVEDLFCILRYAPDFIQETEDYRGMRFDPHSCAGFILNWINDPRKMVLVAEVDGVFAGILMAALEQAIFNFSIEMAREKIFYIRPKFRRFSLARSMVLWYIDWADTNRATRTFISSNAGFKPESAKKFYKRLGFEFSGITACRGRQ